MRDETRDDPADDRTRGLTVWVRIDDAFSDHPKVRRVGLIGAGLQVRALCYAARYLTDGFIPADIAHEWGRGCSAGLVEKMVAVGLWEHAEDGFVIHDYAHYQPSGAEIRFHRDGISQARSEAGKKGMSMRWGNKTDNKQDNSGITTEITNPITTALQQDNPVPVPVSHTRSKEKREGTGRIFLPPSEDEWVSYAKTTWPDWKENDIRAAWAYYGSIKWKGKHDWKLCAKTCYHRGNGKTEKAPNPARALFDAAEVRKKERAEARAKAEAGQEPRP